MRWSPLVLLPTVGTVGWRYAVPETHTFYLGCILWWIVPVTTFLWFIAGDHFLSRSRTSLLTIAVPTVYLCIVDTVALRAGTWHITERTSTGIFVWTDLPLEEGLFFLVTNTLLVCGMSAFERSFAVIDTFGDILAGTAYGASTLTRQQGEGTGIQQDDRQTEKGLNGAATPSTFSSTASASSSSSSPSAHGGDISRPKIPQPSLRHAGEWIGFLIRSLLLQIPNLPSYYLSRVPSFDTTAEILKKHSKSFYTASFIFPSAVRRDLVILYAFCRVLDDFCDESENEQEARRLIDMSKEWLDLLYPRSSSSSSSEKASGPLDPHHLQPSTYTPSPFEISSFLHKKVPEEAQPAFYLLSTIAHKVPRYPFDELIAGYEWDLSSRPILSEGDLVAYSKLVASSVAEMCVWAMWSNEGCSLGTQQECREVLDKAASMGVALQITNIARDMREDATKGRIYIPQEWFRASSGGSTTTTTASSAPSTSPFNADYAALVECAKASRPPSPTEFPYPTYLRKLLDLAEEHKVGTAEAIRKLPRSCQAGIRAATGVYIEIGKAIEKKAFLPSTTTTTSSSTPARACPRPGNPAYDGQRVSMTKWQRIAVALREVYLRG